MVSREYFCHPRGVCERETVLARSRDGHAFVHILLVHARHMFHPSIIVNDSGYPNLHVPPLYAIIGITLCVSQ